MSAAEKILDTIEDTQEVIEETLDVLEKVPAWRCGLSRKQHALQLILVGALAGTVGGLVAYRIGKQKLSAKYEALAKQEIEEAKEFYSALNKRAKFDSPEKVVEDRHPEMTVVRDAAEAVKRYQGKDVDAPVSSIVQSIAEDLDLDDEDVIITKEASDAPYVITHGDFLEAATGYEQQLLTYFAGDDVLVDQNDNAVEVPEDLVGPDTLNRFGHGSGDARTVYVRNNKLNLDFEIIKSDGKYSHEVLGLQHSDETRFEKFRNRQGRGE